MRQHCPPLLNTSQDAHVEKISSPALHKESRKGPYWGLSNAQTTDQPFNRAAAESLQFGLLLDFLKLQRCVFHMLQRLGDRSRVPASPTGPCGPAQQAGRSCPWPLLGLRRAASVVPLSTHEARGFFCLFVFLKHRSAVFET